MSRPTPAGVICRSRAQGGRTGVPKTTTPCSRAGRTLRSGSLTISKRSTCLPIRT